MILFFTYQSSRQVKNPLVMSFPFFLFQIQSGSMMPEIQVGEIILTVKQKQYQENDIITYQTEDGYFITHRILKETSIGYITKGDFNNTEDKAIVKSHQVQGKVIFHSKILGKIYQYRYYLIVIILLLLYKKRRNYVHKEKTRE